MSVSQIVDPTFSLRDVHYNHVKDLILWMHTLSSDNCIKMNTTYVLTECIPRNSSMAGVIAEQGLQELVKEGFKMILCDGRHCRSAIC